MSAPLPPPRARRSRTPYAVMVTLALLLSLAAVSPAAAAPREGEVRVPAGGTPIAGSYIVVLNDGATVAPATSRSRVSKLSRDYDVAPQRTFTRSVRGFSGRMSAQRARQLAADPAVAYVEQDTVVSIDGTQSPATWGLDRIDQRTRPINNSYTYPSTAASVTAYVLDTGIRATHADFGGRARVGADFMTDGRNGVDCNGHGTHVAGTVGGTTYGVAKGVSLVAVRVLGCDGQGSTSGVIAGIDWVTANAAKPAVANLSLGGGVSSSLDAAVRRSVASGVTYALAAGNEKVNACTTSPARTAEAITVGATTSTDVRASYSNFGGCLDLFAPGSSITSTYYLSDTSTATLSGTSMASPHVAGAAALYLQSNPTATPAQVRDALVNAASPVVTGGGTGSPTGLLYTGSIPSAPAQPGPPTTPTTPVALTTLTPTSATNGYGPVETNRSNGGPGLGDGGPLTVGGTTYASGLGVHAASSVTYSLGGSYSSFSAIVGSDDVVGSNGSVVFEVYADGVLKTRTPVLTGASAPYSLTADVSGAATLRLIVTAGGDGADYDHADWADAKLTPSGSTAPAPPGQPLSGLTPTAATSGYGPVELNQSNGGRDSGDGGPLTLNGTTYALGLGAHADSSVSYALGGRYTTFSAVVGVDDAVGSNGSVVFEVYADGVLKTRTAVLTGASAAVPLSVGVAGAGTLQLVVTGAADGTDNDHADWADARVS